MRKYVYLSSVSDEYVKFVAELVLNTDPANVARAGSFELMDYILNTLPVEPYHAVLDRLRYLPYNEFLQTFYWRCCRYEVLQRTRFKCSVCGEKAINAHHVNYEFHGAEHQNLEEVVGLCKRCHNTLHGHETEVSKMIVEKIRDYGIIHLGWQR
jgi:hypothetical protein